MHMQQIQKVDTKTDFMHFYPLLCIQMQILQQISGRYNVWAQVLLAVLAPYKTCNCCTPTVRPLQGQYSNLCAELFIDIR